MWDGKRAAPTVVLVGTEKHAITIAYLSRAKFS